MTSSTLSSVKFCAITLRMMVTGTRSALTPTFRRDQDYVDAALALLAEAAVQLPGVADIAAARSQVETLQVDAARQAQERVPGLNTF